VLGRPVLGRPVLGRPVLGRPVLGRPVRPVLDKAGRPVLAKSVLAGRRQELAGRSLTAGSRPSRSAVGADPRGQKTRPRKPARLPD
jgi:hypothetical protein